MDLNDVMTSYIRKFIDGVENLTGTTQDAQLVEDLEIYEGAIKMLKSINEEISTKSVDNKEES